MFNGHEKVLEKHGCPGEEVCQEKLLSGLQAAWHAVLGSAAAAVVQAAFTVVMLCARDIDIPAAIHWQILPFTNVSDRASLEWSSSTGGQAGLLLPS